MQNKVYIIGIGGIGISAIARYYLHLGYEVFGSDMCDSELIGKLKKEGCDIIIGTSPQPSPLEEMEFNLVIYTEAVPKNNPELLKAKELNIKIQTYPEALAEIVNSKKLIAIAGTHGKSTTTSLTSLVLKNSFESVSAIIGTILKEFGNKNAYFSDSPYFVIEACEYKRSFLKYKPTVAVIVNIEIDHLDYYKDLEDYISAYKEFLDNIKPGGFAILNGEDENCKKLLNIRDNINYIEVYNDYFLFKGEKNNFPKINIQVPGNHILFDAKLAYVVGVMAGIEENTIINSLQDYSGVWRRMEIIGKTQNNNTLMSDYGHHPTEIRLTLEALKNQQKSPIIPFNKGDEQNNKILTIFQPHQYNRTLELLEDFRNCFSNTDKLIIPNIYESRDSEEDKKKINSKKLIGLINHPDKIDGENFEKTLKLIEEWEKQNSNGIILLMGAGNIDNLRQKIKTI